jgi:hypothetical protein
MSQEVTVISDSAVSLKPLIESAIRTELRMLELGLERTSQRLRSFEKQFGMASEEFERRFETGEITESLDFIEWAGEIKTYLLLRTHREALQGARIH